MSPSNNESPNPYSSPQRDDELRPAKKNPSFGYLFLPILVPPVMNGLSLILLDDHYDLFRIIFSLCGLIVGWFWCFSMADRMQLSFWKSYVVSSLGALGVLASSITSSMLFDYLRRSPFSID